MTDFFDWVILTYLDGNNELEPETAGAMREMERTVFSKLNALLLVQAGRLDQKTVGVLRPGREGEPPEEAWSGVRRCAAGQGKAILLKELGNLNMAAPKNLFDFISWGMKFESEHYMLILSGHSCEYIGILSDYSGERPCILGIPELGLALEYVKKTAGKALDLLLLDTCYANNIELLYELGLGGCAVKTLLTHRKTAPAEGLSYRELFKAMDDCPVPGDTPTMIEKITACSSGELVAYEIDARRLEKIKKLFGALGRAYLGERDRDFLGAFRGGSPDAPFREEREELERLASSLMIGRKQGQNPLETICALDKYIPDKGTAALYYRLAFARDNPWTGLLCSRLAEKQFQFAVSIGFSPIPLAGSKVMALIRSSNPGMTEREAEGILAALSSERGWTFDPKSP